MKDLDPGPLWFVLALLIFSVGYAVLARSSARPGPSPVLGVLPSSSAWPRVIAAATFAVRLRFPIDSHQIFVLHVWQWPQCIGLFALGIACAENGWLDPVPDRLRRQAGLAALGGALTIVAALLRQS
ncbi:MAG: hypothetical protein M0C28_35385 [Candidatus Moduliflexus flocculans]|nr:hypothetical protein [Candidatus Moduliflexus flocculans]